MHTTDGNIYESHAKKVTKIGTSIVWLDVSLFVAWIGIGIAVFVLDLLEGGESYMMTHIIISLHFVVTVAVCLVLEHYARITREWRAIKERQSSLIEKKTHISHEHCSIADEPVYMASWAISVVIGQFTDLFSVFEIIERDEWDARKIMELVLSSLCCLMSLFTIAWSIWLFFKMRKTSKKMREYCSIAEKRK
jgi:hypothetical protein